MTTIMDEKLLHIENDVKQIKEALLGTEFSKRGIVQMMEEHETRLDTIERQIDRGKWLIIGLSAGSGIGIYEIIKNIFIR